MKNKQIIAYHLAVEFSFILREWLTEEEMKEVIRKNATVEYLDSCASHDYCDANMAMSEAFTNVIIKAFDLQDDEAVELFNAGWTVAQLHNFFVVNKPYANIVEMASNKAHSEVMRLAALNGDIPQYEEEGSTYYTEKYQDLFDVSYDDIYHSLSIKFNHSND